MRGKGLREKGGRRSREIQERNAQENTFHLREYIQNRNLSTYFLVKGEISWEN
jgi:hypothetical protein